MVLQKDLLFVGFWTEIKLEIIRKYASAYSLILSKQKYIHRVYIDGFCGPGKHISKNGTHFISGSPSIALKIDPPFERFYFIDMDPRKLHAGSMPAGPLWTAFGSASDTLRGLKRCNRDILKLPCRRHEPECFPEETLFGPEESKEDIGRVTEAFRHRLLKVAGFKHVPEPLPVRNSKGAIVYYLFFASWNKTANKTVNDIFGNYVQ